MSILPHQTNGMVCEYRKDDCAARMMYDISLINYVTLLHGIHRDVKNTTVKNLNALEYPGKIFICWRHGGTSLRMHSQLGNFQACLLQDQGTRLANQVE